MTYLNSMQYTEIGSSEIIPLTKYNKGDKINFLRYGMVGDSEIGKIYGEGNYTITIGQIRSNLLLSIANIISPNNLFIGIVIIIIIIFLIIILIFKLRKKKREEKNKQKEVI